MKLTHIGLILPLYNINYIVQSHLMLKEVISILCLDLCRLSISENLTLIEANWSNIIVIWQATFLPIFKEMPDINSLKTTTLIILITQYYYPELIQLSEYLKPSSFWLKNNKIDYFWVQLHLKLKIKMKQRINHMKIDDTGIK